MKVMGSFLMACKTSWDRSQFHDDTPLKMVT